MLKVLPPSLPLSSCERERETERESTPAGIRGGQPWVLFCDLGHASPEVLSVPTQSTGLTQPSQEEARWVPWAPVSADGNLPRQHSAQGGLLTRPPGLTCWRPLLPADPELCSKASFSCSRAALRGFSTLGCI